MVHYKFHYFDGRGLGEVSRELFALAGVQYDDIRYNQQSWPQQKYKMPLRKLPVLDVDGTLIPESYAIARYLARKYGYAGQTPVEQAMVDALADCYKDFYSEITKYYHVALGFAAGDKEQLKEDTLVPARDKYLGIMTHYLQNSATGFLAGGDLTWADLILAESTSTQVDLWPEYADYYPEVVAHRDRVNAIPAIAQWRATRPQTPF